ncbi:MAG: sigma-70 family RNA polymerase sigma factor [Phycisphaerales bacterium]|nr:sigma-70 family RNA polymerase sigma factor [Phycisphaerales bacterium]
MHRSDAQLLVALHKGSEQAARELWSRHSGSMLALARALLCDAAAGEDAVQQVFCRVLSLDRRTLAQVSDARAWLAQLVRREAINQIRAQRRRAAREGRTQAREHPPTAGHPTPAMPADAELRQAVDLLPRRLREIIVLKHVCGLTFDQISVTLGLSRNTAAGRHRQALRALRDALGERDPETEEVEHA